MNRKYIVISCDGQEIIITEKLTAREAQVKVMESVGKGRIFKEIPDIQSVIDAEEMQSVIDRK